MKERKISRIISIIAAVSCLIATLHEFAYAEESTVSLPVAKTLEEGSIATEEMSAVTTLAISEAEPIVTTTTVPIQTDVTTVPFEIMSTETTTVTLGENISIKLGDVDGSGEIDISDASCILLIYASNAAGADHSFSENQVISADCDCSGMVNIEDATLVLGYYSAVASGVFEGEFGEYIVNPPVVTAATTTTTTTTTITTTTAYTTTTTTTTTAMPASTTIAVKCILQNSDPAMPTGCEATALTIAMNYYGFDVDKYDMAMNYMPRMTFTGSYGADFQYVFPGTPTLSSGYGCYAPAIVSTANAYFTAHKNASYAENISGTRFTDFYKYVAEGTPVIIWGTMSMKVPTTGSTWTTPEGKRVTWIRSEHCLVLIGYDKNANTVLISDPLRGNVTYDASVVEARYNTMGKNAVILHPSQEYKGETELVESGAVYRIRNAASGLYLTVAGGIASNGTNLIQSVSDGSSSQQFKIQYDSETNSYKLYVMCSLDGDDRVVDIKKIGGWVVGGSNVQVYKPTDAPAQTFVIEGTSDGRVRFSCRTNRSACLAAYGSSNGSTGGTAYNSAGNAVIQYYSGADNQQWILEKAE